MMGGGEGKSINKIKSLIRTLWFISLFFTLFSRKSVAKMKTEPKVRIYETFGPRPNIGILIEPQNAKK